MRGANMDYLAGMSNEKTLTNDITARWNAAFFQRRWRIGRDFGHAHRTIRPALAFPGCGAAE